MKVAVISDVHSNNEALKSSLAEIQKQGVDKVIFLGDLLTYGCEVNATIETLLEASLLIDIEFVKGNHDQIYFDIRNGKEFQYKPFPDFILESVTYTNNSLRYELENVFPWMDSLIFNNLLFSHANAGDYGDWSYLNSDREILATSKILLDSGFYGGVFGHTHRPKISVIDPRSFLHEVDLYKFNEETGSCIVGNSGSIGQPRGSSPSFLLISFFEGRVSSMEHVFFGYNSGAHKESILKSTLSYKTKEKLLTYFK